MTKTRQEIFDIVVEKMITQNKRSYYSHYCVYQHPKEDLQCAAGCLIDDYDTRINMNTYGQFDSKINKNIIHNKFPHLVEHISFIKALQAIHDSYGMNYEHEHISFAKYFTLEAIKYAHNNNLNCDW